MGQHTPHDALFKAIFADPRVSADVVRRLLPAAAADCIDWSSMKPVPTEFIGADLTDRRADLVFEAPIDGHPGFIFLLLEHQSSPDGRMPARVLIYAVRIIERWLRAHPEAGQVPPVLPVVVYHGDRSWSAPSSLGELYALPPILHDALGPFLPELRLLVDDLTRSSDAEIEASTRVALSTAGLLMLRNGSRLEEPAHLDRLVEHLVAAAQDPDAVDALVQSVCYVYRVSELETGTLEERIVDRVPRPTKEAIVTTAERLEARGEARGRAKGREEGQAQLLLRLIELKFGPPDEATRARVMGAGSDDLGRWGERILTAESLAALLA